MILHKLRKYLKGKRVKSKLQDNRGITLIVVLMVMVILLSVVGAGLLFSGINTKIAMNYRTGTKAFNAADIGITAIATTLTIGGITPAVVPVGPLSNLCYRSGYRDPSVVVSTTPVIKSSAGYSLGSGTGYNASGYAFYQYPIAVTGSYTIGNCPAVGSETAARVVEAQAMFGPVSQ
jgi:hypothetical protein